MKHEIIYDIASIEKREWILHRDGIDIPDGSIAVKLHYSKRIEEAEGKNYPNYYPSYMTFSFPIEVAKNISIKSKMKITFEEIP